MYNHRLLRLKLTAATFILGILLFTTILNSQTMPSGNWRINIRMFAQQIVSAGLTPGMGVAVVLGDHVVYSEGFGSADLDTDRLVDSTTQFYIASSTKSLTASATVLAAYRGDIDLREPLSHYLPQLWLHPPLSADSITVKDLLSLTHGISDDGPIVFRTAYSGEFTSTKLLELLSEYPPSKSGRNFVYGNLGYNILGLILEARFGISWKDVVKREVLQPIGMNSTTAYVSEISPTRIALPHSFTPDGFRRVQLSKADKNMHAAGGHFATATDLARFLAVEETGGMLDGKRILPREPVVDTYKLHAYQDRDFGRFHRFGWGNGWDLGLYETDTLIHRFGSFSGYRSHMSFMPSHQIGVVVLVNGDGSASPAADLMATYIYDRLLGKKKLDVTYSTRIEALRQNAAELKHRIASALTQRQSRQQPLQHPLTIYAGTYENSELGSMVWHIVDGRLEVQIGEARSTTEVYDAAFNKFRVELTGSGEVVQFFFNNGSESASALEYEGERFERQKAANSHK